MRKIELILSRNIFKKAETKNDLNNIIDEEEEEEDIKDNREEKVCQISGPQAQNNNNKQKYDYNNSTTYHNGYNNSTNYHNGRQESHYRNINQNSFRGNNRYKGSNNEQSNRSVRIVCFGCDKVGHSYRHCRNISANKKEEITANFNKYVDS